MLDKYTKKSKKEDDDCQNYLGLKNKECEKNIRDNLEKCYDNIITNYISNKLSNCNVEKQYKISLMQNIKRIINNLNPSFKDFKDSMNINDYIKVKIVENKDFSYSKVIDGFAMTKNVCSKKMREKKENPKILLLDLDLNIHKTNEPLKINRNESNESFNIEELKKKLDLLKIDLILINKGISQNFLNYLLKDSKLIIIVHVKSSSLKKIARCTQGEVISSFKDLDLENHNNSEQNTTKLSSNIYGTCRLFQINSINKLKNENEENKINNIEDLSSFNNIDFKNIILSNNYKLMTFEGCEPILFQTLLLYGPNKKSLKKIKKLLKNEIFPTAREYFLEKNLLYYLYCSIPPFKKEKEKDIEKEKKQCNEELRGISIKIRQKYIVPQREEICRRNTTNLKNLSINKEMLKLGELKNKRKPSKSPESEKKEKDKKKNNNISTISNSLLLKSNIVNLHKLNEKFAFNKNKSKKINNKKEFKNQRYFSYLNKGKKNTNAFHEGNVSYLSCSNNKDKQFLFNRSKFFKSTENQNLKDDNFKRKKNSFDDHEIAHKIENKNKNINKINNSKSYKNGFDISPIILKETSLQLIKLRMCKGESKLNNNNINILNTEEINKNPKAKRNSTSDITLTENALLKSLNFICGEIHKLNIVYYYSKDKEGEENKKNEDNNDKEEDKPLGKLIIDMIAEKDSKCNKCKNIMFNHFYYLYNSDFSRIKIEFISNSDSNLDKVYDFINRENVDFKKYNSENNQNQKIDYGIDIFSYGFCQKCKGIVTPLIKLHKDLFNYSSAKFFKHIFNNKEIRNRNDREQFNLTSFIQTKKCHHLSFHDINRIFVTKYGALKFEYEKLGKYDLISVQNIPDIKDQKYIKSKDINPNDCLNIINLIKGNLIYELEEFKIIEKKINEKNLSKEASNSKDIGAQININSIINPCKNLLKKVIQYLNEINEESFSDESSKRNPDLSTCASKLNDTDSTSIISIKESEKISGEESNKKELPKSSEKNSFPNYIKQLYSQKLENQSKNIGLNKRIYFRISQLKVIYNKIRTILNRIKIFISLELILDEDIKNNSASIQDNNKPSFITDINNKNKIKDSSMDNDNIKNKSLSIKPKALKITGKLVDDKNINSHQIEYDIKDTLDLASNSSNFFESSSIKENSIINNTNNNNGNNLNILADIKENGDNSLKKNEVCPFKSDPNNKSIVVKSQSENLLCKEDEIKEEQNKNKLKNNLEKSKIIENNEEKINLSPETIVKLLIDKYVTIFDYEDKYDNINKNKIYSNMLKIISFYDEQQNDYSSIIEESDLSSIVSYAISSFQYKTFIKEKTNLLDIKRIHHQKESNLNKRTDSINHKGESLNKENQNLYDTLLLFDSSSINYTNVNSKKKKHLLETEILCKDTNHFNVTINTLNNNKFKCQRTSRQTMSNPITSPVGYYSKQSETDKTNFKLESDLEQIEEKISGFFGEIKKINLEVKKLDKNNKFESILKPLNLSNNNNLLNNINAEELLQNNNINSNNNLQQRKKDLLGEFVNSFNNNSKKIKYKNEENLINVIGKKYFDEDLLPQSEIEVVIYYPRQFEALRIAYCCAYEDLLVSLTKSNVWADVSGGKSKATFYKTNDEKYLFKSISQYEFNMFLKIAFAYFNHIDKYLFHNMPSLLMKILGVYKIKIKKQDENKCVVENYYLMMMENLNYGFNFKEDKILSYDLKGSTINRYIKKKEKIEKNNVVLLDSNFKEDFKCEPIPLESDLFGLLLLSVYNDTLFLFKMGIVDYSLLLYINKQDEKSKNNLIRVGIIDFIRKYTWDKQIEHIVKTIINGFNSPTIINPEDYRERFIAAIKSYFIGI